MEQKPILNTALQNPASAAGEAAWVSAVEQLYRLSEGWIDEALLRELNAFRQKALEQRFYLVMVGSFKRGKSSLINAMLGVDLAPVAVVPLTAIITLFEYADEAFAEVHFTHESPQRITLNEIAEYVTEEKNPQNIKRVSYVRIGYPAGLLREVSIVDTPGVGSAFEHNTQTTLSFVPKIDAALFVCSADTPVSRADLELLQTLRAHVPRILFVLNKADLLSEKELIDILQYNRKQVSVAIGADDHFSWHVVSCKSPTEKYAVQHLVSSLQQLIRTEKKQILDQSLRHQYRMLYNQISMQLRLQQETLLMPLHELEQKQQQLQQSMSLMQSRQEEFESLVNSRIRYIRQQVDETIQSLTQQLRRQLQEKYLQQSSSVWKAMQHQGFQSFQEQQTHQLIEAFQRVKSQLEQTTREQFSELLETYASRSQTFLHELTQHLKSLLGVDFHLIADQFDLNVYTAFYFDYGKGLSAAYIPPPFWIKWMPASWAIRQYLKKLYHHYQQLLTTNASAIIYDLQYKIQESFRKFQYDLHAHLELLLNRIQQIIDDTLKHRREHSSQVQQRLSAIEKRLHELSAWKIV